MYRNGVENENGKYKVSSKKKLQEILKKNGNSNGEWHSQENIESGKTETKKYKVKKGTKNSNKRESPKITKTYEKVKRYKVVENEPVQKIKPEKLKPKSKNHEGKDEVLKSPKKIAQKRSLLREEDDFDEELFIEEGRANRQETPLKNQPYEEDFEEDNETLIELGSENEELQRTESEEVIEKYKTIQTVKVPKSKHTSRSLLQSFDEDEEELEDVHGENLLDEFPEDNFPETENLASRYENPGNKMCQKTPDDPNRVGPKKLTLFVIEEEVDGKVRRRVIPEEDGVTMCEVADLLKENFYEGLI